MNQRRALIKLWAAIEASKAMDWETRRFWLRPTFRDPAVRRLLRPQPNEIDPKVEPELYNLMVLCQENNLPCPIPKVK